MTPQHDFVELSIQTRTRVELIDITARVQQALIDQRIREGWCLVYVPHTTAAVTINENADPDVERDIIMALDRMVPGDAPYRHREGNSDAHVKASLMGASELMAVREGRLQLGTWQGLFFCEFDGPRTRRIQVNFAAGGRAMTVRGATP